MTRIPLRGEQIGLSKLTEEKVREMRRLYAEGNVTHAVLAEKYGVALSTIHNALSRITWNHVE